MAADTSAVTSAYAPGADLFERHRGRSDLAERRKELMTDAWARKHRTQRG